MEKHQIINFDICNSSFDEFAVFAAQLEGMATGFNHLGIEAPEWFSERQTEVRMELGNRIRADKQRKLKLLKARRETLFPSDVKLKNIENEIERLEKDLTA